MTDRQHIETPAVVRLSEEHGFIPRGHNNLALGAGVRVIPNHACPVANLARTRVILEGDDVHEWPVEARGRVRSVSPGERN